MEFAEYERVAIERLILFVLMRPLRNVAIATTDEYIIANQIIFLIIIIII